MAVNKIVRRGMTLVELLVVIVIITLLLVTVSPLFQAGSERRRYNEAAALVSSHFNTVISRAIGRTAGEGAWLDATAPAAAAVTALGFTRARNVSGEMTVTAVNAATSTSPPNAMVAVTPALTATAGLVHVAGFPVPYELLNATTLGLLPGYSLDNAAFPALNLPYQYRASITPQPRITASTTQLKNGFCIDLSSSTIGVHGFTDPSEIVPLAGVDTLAVLFDGTGRVSTVWIHTPAPSPAWQWHLLDAQRPLALLVGESRRVGLPPVPSPSEDAPGPNIQSPDAFWVVVDPNSRIVRTIPNNPVAAGASNPTESAQTLVRQALRNN